MAAAQMRKMMEGVVLYRHRQARAAQWLLVRRQDRHCAKGRSRHPPLFEDDAHRILRRHRACQQSCHRRRRCHRQSESRIVLRHRSLRARLRGGRTAGPRISRYSARHRSAATNARPRRKNRSRTRRRRCSDADQDQRELALRRRQRSSRRRPAPCAPSANECAVIHTQAEPHGRCQTRINREAR